MSTPSVISTVQLSSVISAFDLYKPDRLNKLYSRYGGQYAQVLLSMIAMKRERVVAQDTYDHAEDRKIIEVIRVQSNVADPGAGNNITFRLHADYVDANNRHQVRLNDQILFNNEVTGTVISITTGANVDVTVKPSQSTDNIGALTAGDFLSILGNAFSEGAGQPNGVVIGADWFDNDVQILKETFEVTGTEMTNQTWVDMHDEAGNFLGWHLFGKYATEARLMNKAAFTYYFQKRTTSTIADPDPDGLGNIKTTHGKLASYRDRAIDTSVADGAWTIDTFRDLELDMVQQYCADQDVQLDLAIKRRQEIQEVIKEYLDGNGTDYTSLAGRVGGDAESMAAFVNFTSVMPGTSKTFHIRSEEILNHPDVSNHESSKLASAGFASPMGRSKDGNGTLRYRDTVTYKGLGGYSRKMQMWQDGTAGPGPKIGELDTRKIYWLKHMGYEGFALNQCALISKP